MTKPIARDPIYRRRAFDADIIELAGTDSEELWNGLKRGISDSAGLRKRIAYERSGAIPFCNRKCRGFRLLSFLA
jgi:hypothetical protein